MISRILIPFLFACSACGVTSGKTTGVLGKQDGYFTDGGEQYNYRDEKMQQEQPAVVLKIPKVTKPGCGAKRILANKKRFEPAEPWIKLSLPNGVQSSTFYGEVPWMARIYKNGEFLCGGTILSNKAILTAAHTMRSLTPSQLEVEVGEWDSSASHEPIEPQKKKVHRIIVHNDFNIENSANNIALIIIEGAFTFSEAVGSVCIPRDLNGVNQTACLASGWGKPDQGKSFSYTSTLRKVNLPVMARDKCQERLRTTSLGSKFVLRPDFICAGGIDERDTCQGDGGGPLYCPLIADPDRFTIIGVIAWGIDCGRSNPTVLSSVPYFYDWIIKQME